MVPDAIEGLGCIMETDGKQIHVPIQIIHLEVQYLRQLIIVLFKYNIDDLWWKYYV